MAREGKSRIGVDDVIEHFGVGMFQYIKLIILSLAEVADGIEILTLSLLGPTLQCVWQLTAAQAAFITTAVFGGSLAGTMAFSNLADRFGRKPIAVISLCISLVFSLLSSAAPTFIWLLLLRAVFGCSVGTTQVVVCTWLSEISPKTFRAKCQNIMFGSWAIGSFLVAGIGILILPVLSWRWFMVLSTLPILLAVIPLVFSDDSPRFLILNREYKKAMDVLKNMSRLNNKPMPNALIDVSSISATTNHGNIKLLLHPDNRRVTVLLSLAWFISGFTYFGAVLLTVNLPTVTYACLQNSSTFSKVVILTDSSCCPQLLSGRTYVSIFIASLGELLACLLSAYFLDWFGRRKGLAAFGLAAGVVLLCLDFCMPRILHDIHLLLMRCFTLAFNSSMFVYTMEIYPTAIRSSGLGILSSVARLGAMVTSFTAMVMVEENTRLTLFLYSGLSILSAIIILLTGKETKGMMLLEDINQSTAQESEEDEPLNKNLTNMNYDSVTDQKAHQQVVK